MIVKLIWTMLHFIHWTGATCQCTIAMQKRPQLTAQNMFIRALHQSSSTKSNITHCWSQTIDLWTSIEKKFNLNETRWNFLCHFFHAVNIWFPWINDASNILYHTTISKSSIVQIMNWAWNTLPLPLDNFRDFPGKNMPRAFQCVKQILLVAEKCFSF